MSRAGALIGTLLLALQAGASAAQSADADAAPKYWFSPTLTVDNESICAAILEGAVKAFRLRPGSRYGEGLARSDLMTGLSKIDLYADPVTDPIVVARTQNGVALKLRDGKPVNIRFLSYPSCGGGGCIDNHWQISDHLPSDDERPGPADFDTLELPLSTPPSSYWDLYKDPLSNLYAFGSVAGSLHVYRLTTEAWQPACEVLMEPSDPRAGTGDAEFSEALSATDALVRSSAGMSGGYGECGSLKAGWRRLEQTEEGMRILFYRPWSLLRNPNEQYPWQGPATYRQVLADLTYWSAGGIHQHKLFLDYRRSFDAAIVSVARFFMKHFGWESAVASDMAQSALEAAIATGYAFPGGWAQDNEQEHQLRAAILERRPIEEIQDLITGLTPQDCDDCPSTRRSSDSILNIAIEYPEALRELLKQGLNPDEANPFGKTPLMYAAQHDQLEAAEILLDAGANPNAFTILPRDPCIYQLHTTHVTPLHYAARDSSRRLIELLLARGASAYLPAIDNRKPEGHKQVYPRDWLVENEKVSDLDRRSIESMLVVPSAEEMLKQVRTRVLDAQAAYQSGKVDDAYRDLMIALSIDSTNEMANADLSLVALRAGKDGPAMEAATRLIRTTQNSALRASAWFNTGLACEKAGSHVHYNGTSYCTNELVYPFLRAYQTAPTTARAEKLRDLIERAGESGCTAESTDGRLQAVRFARTGNADAPETISYRYVERVYMLHDSSQKIVKSPVEWDITLGKKLVNVVPEVVQAVDLRNGKTLTVLEAKHPSTKPRIYGKACSLSR